MLPNILVSIPASAGVSAVLSAALIWLSKTWISERLKSAIKHEYDQKLEAHKAQLKAEQEIALARKRAGLEVLVAEHHIRFSKLHEKRDNALADLFAKLKGAQNAIGTCEIELAGGALDELEKHGREADQAWALAREAFDRVSLYLPTRVDKTVEAVVRDLFDLALPCLLDHKNPDKLAAHFKNNTTREK
jgi:hypothetical protein